MKKLPSLFVIIISLYLIVSLVRSIWQLYRAGDRVVEAEKIKQTELVRNQELTKALEASKSSEFVERMARDKLNMSKRGEMILILPELPELKKRLQLTEQKLAVEPNLKKWVRLFE